MAKEQTSLLAGDDDSFIISPEKAKAMREDSARDAMEPLSPEEQARLTLGLSSGKS
ncbi:MAG: hypothetical protein V4449_02855 [Patescibacteria group bacterium]